MCQEEQCHKMQCDLISKRVKQIMDVMRRTARSCHPRQASDCRSKFVSSVILSSTGRSRHAAIVFLQGCCMPLQAETAVAMLLLPHHSASVGKSN